MKFSKFSKFLKHIHEETSSADIATVDTKLDISARHPLKHLQKGKRCKEHKELNCEACQELEEKYN